MTLFGKILVVLNLALAILFLGMAGATYTARLDLQKEVETNKKTVTAEKKKSAELALESGTLTNELKGVKEKLDDEVKKSAKSNRDKDALVANAIDQADGFRKQIDVVNQRLAQVTDEASRRKEEVDQLRKIRQEQIEKIGTLSTALSEERDVIAQRKNDNEVLADVNRKISEEFRHLKIWVGRQGLTLPSPEDAKNIAESGDQSPVPEVQGIVKKLDGTGKFIQISLGENDGIKAGHVLKVWRMAPNAKYLGEIKVFTTQVNTAVAKPVSVTGPIQEGDYVGPNVLMNR
jgi:hypothetical protein